MSADIVTGHALLRYLERAKGIDVAAANRELEAIVADPIAAGAQYLNRAGLHYVFRDGRCITVSPGIGRARERQSACARQRTAYAEARGCR